MHNGQKLTNETSGWWCCCIPGVHTVDETLMVGPSEEANVEATWSMERPTKSGTGSSENCQIFQKILKIKRHNFA